MYVCVRYVVFFWFSLLFVVSCCCIVFSIVLFLYCSCFVFLCSCCAFCVIVSVLGQSVVIWFTVLLCMISASIFVAFRKQPQFTCILCVLFYLADGVLCRVVF